MAPRIGVLLGDPNGVGPELAARLLAAADVRARAAIVVIGDSRVLRMGERAAGGTVAIEAVADIARADPAAGRPVLLDRVPIAAPAITPGRATAAAGRWVYATIRLALDLARDGAIDGLCFAPMNKKALKMGGAPFADEHELFAALLGFDGPRCEINVLDDLWTTRVTSHIPLAAVAGRITIDRVAERIRLADAALRAAGKARPRIAVAALNPHGGEGGVFGTEEGEIIAPAIARARADGIAAEGPFPADTVFVRAREGAFDAVVTMYHDQGQIAMKLLGFARGVTVSGGLPLPIATPASGTAFDIVGEGVADAEGMRRAFFLVCRMAEARGAAAGPRPE